MKNETGIPRVCGFSDLASPQIHPLLITKIMINDSLKAVIHYSINPCDSKIIKIFFESLIQAMGVPVFNS